MLWLNSQMWLVGAGLNSTATGHAHCCRKSYQWYTPINSCAVCQLNLQLKMIYTRQFWWKRWLAAQNQSLRLRFKKEYDANLEQAFPEPDFKHFNFSTSLRNNLTPFNSVWNSNLRKPQSSGLKKHVSNVIYLREIQGKEEKSAQIECQMNLQIFNLEKWYWWTYWQGRNRDAENRLADRRQGRRERDRVALTYTH